VIKTMLYMICLKTAFLKALVVIWDLEAAVQEGILDSLSWFCEILLMKLVREYVQRQSPFESH